MFQMMESVNSPISYLGRIMKRIFISTITILFLFFALTYQVTAESNARNQNANQQSNANKNISPSPSVIPSPASADPTPASSIDSTSEDQQSGAAVIAFPQSSTSSDQDSEPTDDNSPDPSPTPVLVPLHPTTQSPAAFYPAKTTQNKAQQPLIKSPFQIAGDLILNRNDSAEGNLYNSENLSPVLTKFLLILSFCLFSIGIVLVNFDRLSWLADGIFSQRKDSSTIMTGFDNL